MRHDNRSESLYRLTYCSRNTIETHISDADIEGELRGILATARRCNKENDITGALLFTASGFAQVLEGPRDVVERTFERISTDPRHADVRTIRSRRCWPTPGSQARMRTPAATFYAFWKIWFSKRIHRFSRNGHRGLLATSIC
jgi:hypothetical protein